ncbi:MAG: hypothetical protein GY765_19985 [bacterium]|nr:hypothetical protein [bacterium]
MNTNDYWDIEQRSTEKRAEAHLKNLHIPLSKRFDISLPAALLVILTGFGILCIIALIIGNQFDLFKTPTIRTVKDTRILHNIHDNISQKPLLDAAYHQPNNKLYISQTGGYIHRYDPSVKLWTTEKPFPAAANIDIHQLRSGNGTDPLSTLPKNDPDPNSIWGISRNAGLVRLVKDNWQQIIGSSLFVGWQEEPVPEDQLISAAVSPDKKWLVIGTIEDGFGVYDIKARKWLTIELRILEALPSETVSHIKWWQNRFWLGGPNGMVSLKVAENKALLLLKPSFDGTILDLDVDKQNRLWVLENRDCGKKAKSCLRLTRLQDLSIPAETLIDEQNIFPSLKSTDFHFAQYWENRLILAGKKGVFSYNTTTHNWTQVFKKPVLCTRPHLDACGFFFGFNGGVGHIAKGYSEPWDPAKSTKTWITKLPGQRIVKLRGNTNDEALALNSVGKVFAITNGKAVTAFKRDSTKLKPTEFFGAFSFGPNVLLTSAKGAMVHNVETRTYKDIASASLPKWLTNPDLNLVTSGEITYVAIPKGDRTSVFQLPTESVARGDFKNAGFVIDVPGKLRVLRDWDNRGVVAVIGDSIDDARVYRFSPGVQYLTGPPLTSSALLGELGNQPRILDVAASTTGLMVASDVGLLHYNYKNRSWMKFNLNVPPRELTVFKNQLLVISTSGQLLKMSPKQKATPLMGGLETDKTKSTKPGGRSYTGVNRTPRFQLSDVVERSGNLYLAGNGTVRFYDSRERAVSKSWDLPGSGSVKLIDIIEGKPLALSNSRATLGKKIIDAHAGPVVTISTDKRFIWTVRILDGRKYLKRYPRNIPTFAQGKSFFRNPGAGRGVDKIMDAVVLQNKLIAVATNKGLRFYSPEARSWYTPYPAMWVPSGDRLYLLEQYLVVADSQAGNGGMSFIKLKSIEAPDESSAQVRLKEPPQKVRATAFTVDSEGRRAAYIDQQGRVVQWLNGKLKESLPATLEAPPAKQLRRVYDRSIQNTTTHSAGSQKTNSPGEKGDKATAAGKTGTSPGAVGEGNPSGEAGNPSRVASNPSGVAGKPSRVAGPSRVTGVAGALFFTTEGSILRYDLKKHLWQEIKPSIQPAGDIDIQQDGLKEIVTLRDRNGSFYTGSFLTTQNPAKMKRLQMKLIYRPPGPGGLNCTGRELLDIQDRGDNVWTFLLKDRIKYYSPRTRQWSAAIPVPGANGDLEFRRVGNTGVVVDKSRRTWWVAKQKGARPTDFAVFYLQPSESTALDSNGNIWSFTKEGKLYKYRKPNSGNYSLTAQTLYSAPFVINPDTVTRAFKQGNIILFETRTGLRLLDAVTGKELRAGSATRNFKGIKEAFFSGGHLWLRNAGNLLALNFSNGRINASSFPGVSAVTVDKNRYLWARFTDGWRYWKTDVFKRPAGSNGVRLFISEGGEMSGLNRLGQPYWWEWWLSGGLRADTTIFPSNLPFPLTSIRTMSKGLGSEWWVVAGNKLYLLALRHKPTTTGKGGAGIDAYTVVRKFDFPTGFGNPGRSIHLRLKSERMLELIDSESNFIKINDYTMSKPVKRQFLTVLRARNQWEELKGKVVKLPNGGTAYAPITGISVDASGALLALRGKQTQQLAAKASMTFGTLPPALDAGWLKWDRAKKCLQVKTPNKTISLAPGEFIKNRRLIFEEINALLVFGSTSAYAANIFGILSFKEQSLDLSNTGNTFLPLRWQVPEGAAHGRFFGNGVCYDVGGKKMPKVDQRYRFYVGDVIVSEDISRRRVMAGIKMNDGVHEAFGLHGFKWDNERRGVYFGKNSQLFIQSDAGVHPVSGYSSFSSRPLPGLLKPYQLPKQQARRVLVDNPVWRWEKKNNIVSIRLKNNSHGFNAQVGKEGFGFTSDRLVDALTYKNRLFVMSEAFMEIVDAAGGFLNRGQAKKKAEGGRTKAERIKIENEQKRGQAGLSGPGGLRARRYPSRPMTAFRNITDAAGRNDLLLINRSNRYYWNKSKSAFQPTAPAGASPSGAGDLLCQIPQNQPILRFRNTGRGIVSEVRLKAINGNEAWLPFSFNGVQFPFDRVTSIACDSERIYVGTGAGLQVYAGLETRLTDIEHFYFMGGGTYRPSAVTKVGRPMDQPDIIVARSANAALKTRGNGTFSTCTTPNQLNRRQRIVDDTWRFIDVNGKVVGRYKDVTGNYSSDPISIRAGRLPHDRYKDIAVFDGQVYILWQTGWVTLQPDLEFRFRADAESHNLQRVRPLFFIPIPVNLGLTDSGGILVTRGLYLEAAGGRVFQYIRGTWVEIARGTVSNEILAFAKRPPIVNHDNLRLLAPVAGRDGVTRFDFQHRGPDNIWRPIPWKDGRLIIDYWSDFFLLGDRTWAATPIGLVSFTRSQDGKIILDPNTMTIVPTPIVREPDVEVTDIMVEGEQVTIRYETDGKRVFRGKPGEAVGGGAKIFKPLETDPFAERVLVSQESSGFWQWKLKGCSDRSAGWLEARLRGQELRFIDGRFECDTINSLAFFQDQTIEIGTRSGGWYRSTGGLDAASLQRPKVPGIDFKTIDRVLLTRQGEEAVLGLRTHRGDFMRLKTDGGLERTAGCAEYLCEDGFWNYGKILPRVAKATDEGQLEITAIRNRGGVARRFVEGGRFTDDIVLGMPVAVSGKEGIYYVVPTRAGVLRFDQSLSAQSVYAGLFPGMEPEEVPSVLYVDAGKSVCYVAPDGLHQLEGGRESRPGITPYMPSGGTLTAVEDGPQGFIRSRWDFKGRRGWSLSRPGKDAAEGDNIFFIDISKFSRYLKNRSSWGNPQPWLQVHMDPQRMEVFRLGKSLGVKLQFPLRLQLLSPVVIDEKLYIIGSGQLYEVDFDRILAQSFQAQKQ